MASTRWKFWGWGIEGTGLDAGEQKRLFDFYRTLGAPEGERRTVPDVAEIDLRPPRVSPPAPLAAICTSEPYERLLHTYGKSFPEAVRIFARDFGNAPDVVASPRSEAEVVAVLDWAADADAAVIPFGGGSSVVGGVEPAVGESFAGTISLDLKGLDRLLEVDRTSRAARMQGGMLGPAIEAALKPHGLTLRHFPQSFEFSTLGGWIATRSGGHFATLYTHIEDFLESMRVITPAGAIETRRLPGSGAGPSPDRLFAGSEGSLGVITEAWLRLQDRPSHRATVAIGFASLFEAARAVRAVAQAGLYPSNLRVLDPMEAKVNGAGDGSFALLVLGLRVRRSSGRAVARPRPRALRRSRRPLRGRPGCASRAAAGRCRRGLAPGLHPHAVRARAADADLGAERHFRDRHHLGSVRSLPRPGQGRNRAGDQRRRPAGLASSPAASPMSIRTVRRPTSPSTPWAAPTRSWSSGGMSRVRPRMR